MIDDNNKDLENIEEQFCTTCDGKGNMDRTDSHGRITYIDCPDCSGLGVKNTRTKQTNAN